VLLCSFAPLIAILGLAVTLSYDPFRGRLAMFATGLAAVSWGALRRWPGVVWGVVGLAVTSMAMSLAYSEARPSGLDLFVNRNTFLDLSIWEKSRTDQQALLRPYTPEIEVLRFFNERVSEDTTVAVAAQPNDYLSPYFGPRLGRKVILVDDRGLPDVDAAAWLVVSPGSRFEPCATRWRTVLRPGAGWKVFRRTAPGACPEPA
jgi:hypothetical protein